MVTKPRAIDQLIFELRYDINTDVLDRRGALFQLYSKIFDTVNLSPTGDGIACNQDSTNLTVQSFRFGFDASDVKDEASFYKRLQRSIKLFYDFSNPALTRIGLRRISSSVCASEDEATNYITERFFHNVSFRGLPETPTARNIGFYVGDPHNRRINISIASGTRHEGVVQIVPTAQPKISKQVPILLSDIDAYREHSAREYSVDEVLEFISDCRTKIEQDIIRLIWE